ncbi:MAG: gliding motility lipoprotein GldH [Microscillaceae bacterium]|nr:gliding motility lipoprotein GldH [Microscillaceae bacterium]MDW8460657.1 hypothetical protein [Cytophagales bacterium]
MKSQVIGYFFLFAALLACQSDKAYKIFYTFSDIRWERKEIVTLSQEINFQDIKKAKLGISLRHVSHIFLEKLPLEILIQEPNGKTTNLSVEMPLRDTQSKKLLGEAVGDICDTDFLTDFSFDVKQSGKYTFTIKHNFREEKLGDVIKIGIFVKKLSE